MEPEREKEKLILLVGLGLLLSTILMYVPWIYIFHFLSAGVVLYFIIEKFQNGKKIHNIPEHQERALAIPRRLEDPQLTANLQEAEQLVGRMINVAPAMQRDLDRILRNNEHVQRNCQRYTTFFPMWRRSADKTIKELGCVRIKLDDVCTTANYIKAGGDVAAILGGVGVMAGAVFPPIAAGAALFQAMKITGDVIVPTATLLENMFSEAYICEVKLVFQEHARHSEPIIDLLGFSRDLDRAFQETFQCSFKEAAPEQLMERIYDQIKGIKYLVDAVKIGRQIQRGGEVFNTENGNTLSEIVKRLKNIKKEFENPRELRVVTSAVQLAAALNGLGYVDCYAKGLALLALKHLLQHFNLTLTSEMGVAVQCLNEVPNMAMHAFSLGTSLKIAREGKSEYSAPISELEYQLQMELNLLSERYDEMR